MYAGTTDGALWMTRDSGQTWTALYSTKGKKDAEKKEESSDKSSDKSDEESSDKSVSEKDSPKSDSKKDALTGVWVGQMISDRFPEGQAPPITFTIKLEDGKVTGALEGRRGSQEFDTASFDSDSGELNISIEGRRGSREYTATVKGEKMTGQMSSDRFEVDFEATRQRDPNNSDPAVDRADAGNVLLVSRTGFSAALLSGIISGGQENDDPISGTWNAVLENDQLPDGRIEVTIEMKMDKNNDITGTLESSRGEMEIVEGAYKPKTKSLYFVAENEQVTIDVEATLSGKGLAGDISINSGMLNAEFEATQASSSAAKVGQVAESESEKQEEARQDEQPVRERGFLGVQVTNTLEISSVVENAAAEKAGVQAGDKITSLGDKAVSSRDELIAGLRNVYAGDKLKLVVDRGGDGKSFELELGTAPQQAQAGRRNRPAVDRPEADRPNPAEQKAEEVASDEKQSSADDRVSGTWTGTMSSRQGERDLTITLVRKSDTEISGTYETSQGERDINEGKFDPKTNRLTLVADNDRFSLEFSGDVKADKFTGLLEFNRGQFEMEFEVERTEKPKTGIAKTESSGAKTSKEKPSGATLADLLPGPRWVSSLHASKFKSERCYVTFDGHRSNDDLPHLYVTEDYGKTWKSIRGNLPLTAGSARVLREDLENENLLYLGCEFGAWVSIDRGKTWTKFKNLPTVSVHEIAMHPTAGEIVAATHGRSLWVADVTMLRQVTPGKVTSNSELFKPRNVIKWRTGARRGSSGTRRFVGKNPSSSLSVAYSLGKNARTVELMITDINGETVKRFEELSTSKGVHQLSWDLRTAGARGRFGPRASVGEYLVNLRVDGENHVQRLTIENDPSTPSDAVAEDEELEFWLEAGFEDQ